MSYLSSDDARIIANRFAVGIRLGSGLQGKVYQGLDLSTEKPVALKVMDRMKLMENPRVLENLKREVNALHRISHENVVKALDIIWNTQFDRKNKDHKRDVVVLVLELVQGGELFDYMMYTGGFTEDLARRFFQQLVSALQHCHKNGVYHRDLKPENLLLSQDFCLKIADFGLSSVSDDVNGAASLLRTQCGTRSYMAPEVLSRAPYRGDAADVWSSAVILFIMVAGFPPFSQAVPGDWWFDRLREGRPKLFWQAHMRSASFSPAFMDLINRMLKVNPQERADFDTVCSHPWFTAPALDEAAAHKAMSERLAKVEHHKRMERAQTEQRKIAKKQAATAFTAFDPFAEDVMRGGSAVYTSSNISAPGSANTTAVIAPEWPEKNVPTSSPMLRTFRAVGPAYEVLCDLSSELMSHYGITPRKVVRSNQKLSLKATIRQNCVITINIFRPSETIESEGEIHIIHVVREQGDALTFYEVFDALSRKLGSNSKTSQNQLDSIKCSSVPPSNFEGIDIEDNCTSED